MPELVLISWALFKANIGVMYLLGSSQITENCLTLFH